MNKVNQDNILNLKENEITLHNFAHDGKYLLLNNTKNVIKE